MEGNSQGRGTTSRGELSVRGDFQGRGTLGKAKFKLPGAEDSYANSYIDRDKGYRVYGYGV